MIDIGGWICNCVVRGPGIRIICGVIIIFVRLITFVRIIFVY